MTSSSRTLKKNVSKRKTSREQTSPKAAPYKKAKNTKIENKKYGNRYKPPIPMSEEEEIVWRNNQRKERNRISAKNSREERKRQVEEAKKEVEDWERKCVCLKNKKEILEKEKGEPVFKTIDAFSHVSTCIEEQIMSSSKVTFTTKDAKSENKKYGNRYQPRVEMSGESLSQWRAKERKERNKKTAAKCRNKQQKKLPKLRQQVKDLKEAHDSLQECVEQLLEKTTPTFKNIDVLSDVWTGSEEHDVTGLERELSYDLTDIIPEGMLCIDFANQRANNISMRFVSTLSTRSLLDGQDNRSDNMRGAPLRRISSRQLNALMNDKKIHSFAIRYEDSVPTQSTSEDSLRHVSKSRNNFGLVFDSRSSTFFPLLNEQQRQQYATTVTGIQHDCSNQMISTDRRTAARCDRDLDERMAELKKNI